MIKKRGLLSYILLSGITGGIYGWWRIHVLARDMNLMFEGDGKKTRGFLAFFFFGLLTFGIYNLIWLYMVGGRLYDNAKRFNLTFKEGGGTVLLWFLPGSLIIIGPIIAMHIIFKNTNALADEYNKNQKNTNVLANEHTKNQNTHANSIEENGSGLYIVTKEIKLYQDDYFYNDVVADLKDGDIVEYVSSGIRASVGNKTARMWKVKMVDGRMGFCFSGFLEKNSSNLTTL